MPALRSFTLLSLVAAVGCGGLEDYGKLLDSGAPSPVGDDGDTLPGTTDTGLTTGSGSGSGGDDGSGDGGSGDGGSGDGGAGDGGSGDGGDDGDPDPIELAIDSVTPAYGSNAGGDLITITGGPFDASAVVEISATEAVVSSVTETELVVVTPAVPRTGLATITVDTDAGSGRLSNAFRYWEDASGLYGMIGVIEHSSYTGGYWDGGTPDDIYDASVYFSDPTATRWYELMVPVLDTCRSETWSSSAAVTVFDPGLTSIDLRPTSGSTISLPYDGLGFSDEPTSLTKGARYDLVAPVGGSLPTEDVSAVVQLPSSPPTVSTPALSDSYPPDIGQYQSFRWTSGGADWVIITMILDNGVTSDGYEVVRCAVTDDGSFNFDGSQFALWSTGSVAIVSVGFVYDQSATILPWNRGTSSIAGIVSVVGGGITY